MAGRMGSSRYMRCLVWLCLLWSVLFSLPLRAAERQPLVVGVELRGSVNPGSAGFFSRALQEAAAMEADAVLLEIDTPGGLVSSLRSMVQGVLGSPVPVIAYVAPSGAQAASAGALLVLSAHVAAMSPGTEIGAAHPVGLGLPGSGEEAGASLEKAVNDLAAFARSLAEERGRNAEWAERAVRESLASSAREALKAGVVELVVADREALFLQLEGREVVTQAGSVTLRLAGAEVVQLKPGFRERALMTLANPDLAYIFFLAGLLGLYFEFSNPGSILPGTAGALSLLLGLYALQALSVNVAGLLLLLLAVVFLVLELFVSSGGFLAVGGLVALFFGSLMLFDGPVTGVDLSLGVFLPVFLLFSAAVAAILFALLRSARSPKASGLEGMVGQTGSVVHGLQPGVAGKVFVHGELWEALSWEPLTEGAPVRVERVEGMLLHVKALQEE